MASRLGLAILPPPARLLRHLAKPSCLPHSTCSTGLISSTHLARIGMTIHTGLRTPTLQHLPEQVICSSGEEGAHLRIIRSGIVNFERDGATRELRYCDYFGEVRACSPPLQSPVAPFPPSYPEPPLGLCPHTPAVYLSHPPAPSRRGERCWPSAHPPLLARCAPPPLGLTAAGRIANPPLLPACFPPQGELLTDARLPCTATAATRVEMLEMAREDVRYLFRRRPLLMSRIQQRARLGYTASWAAIGANSVFANFSMSQVRRGAPPPPISLNLTLFFLSLSLFRQGLPAPGVALPVQQPQPGPGSPHPRPTPLTLSLTPTPHWRT
eukprot:scaffold20123_cov73-Isochrysis_galbana.AAC.2